MTASPTATDGFRRRSDSSSVLPPLASLYPSNEPQSVLTNNSRRSHSTESNVSANDPPRKPSEKLATYAASDIPSSEHMVDGDYVWDHPNTGYKRKWSESNSSSPGQPYGLQKSDIDAVSHNSHLRFRMMFIKLSSRLLSALQI